MDRGKPKIENAYEKHLKEYAASVVPANNKDGFKIKYVYCGPWYIWDLPQAQLKREKNVIAAEYLGSVAAYVLTAALVRDTNSLALVAFPAIVAMIALFMETFGILQFRFAAYKTSRSTYTVADRRMRIYPMLLMASAGLASLGAVYYMIGFGFSPDRLGASIGYAIVAALACALWLRYRRIPFTTEKNDTIDHIEVAG